MASTDTLDPVRGLSAEGRLLLAAAGGRAMDDTIRALAAGPVDWDAIIAYAVRERAESVLWTRLKDAGVAVPPATASMLQALAIRSDLRMALLERRLEETIAALAGAKVPVLLLKGAALGRTVYGGFPQRPMLDLDLLVPREHAEAARDAALASGWVRGEMERKVAFYEGHNHLPPLHDARGRDFNLEIHTSLFVPGHPFQWTDDQVWERSAAIPGSPARVQSLEDLLLHVALHFFWSHAGYFGPWRAIRDVRALAEQPALDWDRFVARARETRGATAAHWTLRLARLLAGAAVPERVEVALRPPLPVATLGMFDRHFAIRWFASGLPCPSRRLERWLWRAAVRPGSSGHGDAVPWTRDPLFLDPDPNKVPEPVTRKVIRHLGSPGRYLRYLQNIILGTAQ